MMTTTTNQSSEFKFILFFFFTGIMCYDCFGVQSSTQKTETEAVAHIVVGCFWSALVAAESQPSTFPPKPLFLMHTRTLDNGTANKLNLVTHTIDSLLVRVLAHLNSLPLTSSSIVSPLEKLFCILCGSVLCVQSAIVLTLSVAVGWSGLQTARDIFFSSWIKGDICGFLWFRTLS